MVLPAGVTLVKRKEKRQKMKEKTALGNLSFIFCLFSFRFYYFLLTFCFHLA